MKLLLSHYALFMWVIVFALIGAGSGIAYALKWIGGL